MDLAFVSRAILRYLSVVLIIVFFFFLRIYKESMNYQNMIVINPISFDYSFFGYILYRVEK